MKNIALCAIAALAVACSAPQKDTLGLSDEAFGKATVDGKEIALYTLTNANGMTAQFTNLGAKVVSLYAPDKNGNFADVVLGYATAAEYAQCDQGTGVGEAFFGATIGRYGNRIANAQFTIDSVTYKLDVNENNATCLHGGRFGFFAKVWEVKNVGAQEITFAYLSPDGEMGFPGNLNVELTYKLTDDNALQIDYKATTDAKTVVNLTNHSFFNLSGEGAETINDHIVSIVADNITPVDSMLIPTGELMPVAGTPFDFNTPRVIGDSLASQHPQMLLGNGYDHNWVLSKYDGTLQLAATVKEPKSGRKMEVYTTEPGLQFYAGNFINGTQKGKSGKLYQFRSGFCMETQHFPDSPNKPQFPSVRLDSGQTYTHTCVYKFVAE